MEAQSEAGMLSAAPVEMQYAGNNNGVAQYQAAMHQQQYQAQVQRPSFPAMPAATSGNKWQMLEQVPISQAWMVLDRMTPQDWQQRQLVVN
jgi:hypothetical protein